MTKQSTTVKKRLPVKNRGFKLGHVFKVRDLPKSKKHLVNWLYFGDRKDGRMCLVETKKAARHGDAVADYSAFENHLNSIKANNRAPSAHIGTMRDWNSLLNSEFSKSAGLNMRGSIPGGAYWERNKENHRANTYIRYMNDGFRLYICKNNSTARGRIFQDVPRFSPMLN